MKKYILAIDAGTSSSRALLFDHQGNTVALEQEEFTQNFPHQGWVEHDAIEIWDTQLRVLQRLLQNSGVSPEEIAAVGITNQRETTVVWDRKTGTPVRKAIVWQDRRTADFCEHLQQQGKAPLFYEKTGLVLDAYFSGTKIRWILNSKPKIRTAAEKGTLAFGTIDSWLIWKLTQGKVHVTDATNASRTLLFNIHTQKWDDELLDLLEVPKSLLAKVVDSSEVVGTTAEELLGAALPIAGIAGDQQAALFGQLCTAPGTVKNTYGTGCFCIMNTGKTPVVSKNKMLTTIAYRLQGEVTYAIEGSVFIAGALVQWLRDQMQLIESAAEIETLAETVTDNGGLTFVPALSGLGAPHWNPHATGALMGITRGTSKGHIARAALEAIALRTREIIIAMQKDAGVTFESLKVDGGASTNNLLMQLQADVLNTTVIRPKNTETTALGAAFFAGLAVGFWDSLEELTERWEYERSFQPNPTTDVENILQLWNKRINALP